MQSWITGLDVCEGDATLAFMEGSHNFHEECGKKFKLTDTSNWHKLTKEQEDFYISKGCSYKSITCPKGSLVCWDSRLIHCGVEASKGRPEAHTRAIVYLCYMPRSLSTPTLLTKKRKAWDELRTTTHWPCTPKLFPKHPRTYGNALPDVVDVERPVLSHLGKRLAGLQVPKKETASSTSTSATSESTSKTSTSASA